VHVDVKETDRVQMVNVESRLLGGLAKAGLFRRLTRIDVPAGLNPYSKPLMQMENDAA
jgi:hypothetical protein